MNAHLADAHALLQRLFAEFWTDAGRVQRTVAVLPHNSFRIEFGVNDPHLGVANPEFVEHVLGDPKHGIEIAVAAGHAATADDDRATDPLAGLDHVPVIGFHR